MRKLLAALSLGCLLAGPGIATDWNAEVDDLARRWAVAQAAQSEWRDEHPHAIPAVQLIEPVPAYRRIGDGWALLDGWMRGDPLLRQWVAFRFDSDGDGALSAGEAAMARRVFYSLADTNRSGVITSEEFLNGWGTVRAAMFEGYALAG